MTFKKVVAIFDELRLGAVKASLFKHGITGFTVNEVYGRGNYFNAINEEHMIKHIQLNIYTIAENAEKIAKLIVKIAHVNADAEGLVAIEAVDNLYWIHTQLPSTAEDHKFHGDS
ncbi:P-II family nitrogen regulator [Photobacterium sp.]|uniref:P-II family nitrogen regulator n=1 Tax=Photobacterium sp. TaxID=660 RepID=UPI00299E2065|nr:P-II family nitrogen regulator [Photobacterium sp.]MDX1301520.1 P-II family nitrogen regulator [Photobacterium sp.]